MDACTFFLFGATGDLAHGKLIPALYLLEAKNVLPKEMRIILIARKETDVHKLATGYRKYISKERYRKTHWNRLVKRMIYCRLEFHDADAYDRLAKVVAGLPAGRNRLFYLATPQESFSLIVEHLARTDLAENNPRRGWHRVVFEKPFGSDLRSARALNKEITRLFGESQIFRIDHYIGKSFVQEILALRFANPIFEHLWNAEYIDAVEIAISETTGVGSRGGYYDKSGAIRDMFQNHLMQLLSLIAMEPPATNAADDIRDAKAAVLKSVQRRGKRQLKEELVLGQYTHGHAGGTHLPSYVHEDGVDERSTTETFVATTLKIDNRRWRNVPFYLWTGKALAEKYAQILIRFKPGDWLKIPDDKGIVHENLLIIRIQPEEGLKIHINLSDDSDAATAYPHTLDFTREASARLNTTESYELLIKEAMLGDHTLFTRWDFVEQSWKITDNIRKGTPFLHQYKAGSKGPLAALRLLRHRHHLNTG